MRKIWLLGVVGLLVTAPGFAQEQRRTIGSPLKPSPGAAPSATAGSGAFKPSSAPPANRFSTADASATTTPRPAAGGSAFQPSADTGSESEAASPPATGFSDRATFGGSRFQASDGAPAIGSANTIDSEPETMEATEAPAARSFAPAPSTAMPARSSTSGGTTTNGLTTGGTATTAPRSFNSSPSTTTTTTTTPTRNSLPARAPASRPAVANAATPINSGEAASPIAEALLKQALEPRAQHELPGQPMPLSAIIERGGSAAHRIRAVQTYWKLVTKVAAYHAAMDDRQLFAQLNSRQLAQHDRTTLAAAQQSAEAALSHAELDFVTTQNELSDLVHFSDVELQALPSDLPLVSEYRTHFTTLYGSGAAPSGLRRLDRAMPYHLKNVRSRADAVVAAQQAVQAAAEAVATGQASASSLLEVHRHYANQRSAFALAVFDYNSMIAEYALNVAPHQSTGTIVGMLIKTKPAATARQQQSTIRAASAEAPVVADDAPQLQPALVEPNENAAPVTEYALPRQAIRYQIEEAATEETIIEDSALVAPDPTTTWR